MCSNQAGEHAEMSKRVKQKSWEKLVMIAKKMQAETQIKDIATDGPLHQ